MVTEVAKAGAAKWGTLTAEEKKPYEEDAAERKVRMTRHRKLWKCLPECVGIARYGCCVHRV